MQSKTTRSIMAIGATSLLALATIAPAQAQSAPEASSPGGSVDNALRDIIIGSSERPNSSGSSLDTTLNSLALIGSSELPISGPLLSSDGNYPLDTDPAITEAKIVHKTVEADRHQVNPGEDRVQRWTVASPSMKRNVSVEVMKAPDPSAPAPLLYLLDGVSAPKLSGWISIGGAQEALGNENVHVVIPTQAPGSWYSDWIEEDPALGTNMWETFITEELGPLLEEDADLNTNGKSGIGGLSMGATGAVHIANANPDIFDATFGISGCYSPMSAIGRQITNIVTTSRGGNVENMWGTYGSEEWIAHDTASNPEGLRDQAVYLSAANGTIGEDDQISYENDDVTSMLAGAVLERGVLTCTEDLDTGMAKAGMSHQVVDYKDEGVHNWRNFNAQLQPAWDAIKPALLS